jgi:hypothetical protein
VEASDWAGGGGAWCGSAGRWQQRPERVVGLSWEGEDIEGGWGDGGAAGGGCGRGGGEGEGGGEVRRVNWLLSIKCSIIFYYHNHLLSMW